MMPLILILIILAVLFFGGGGFGYSRGYNNYGHTGIGLGGVILIVLVVLFLTGNLR
jgi:hypothetical protein